MNWRLFLAVDLGVIAAALGGFLVLLIWAALLGWTIRETGRQAIKALRPSAWSWRFWREKDAP